MRLLKAFVIGMAVLTVVGVGVLIWGLVHQWNKAGERPSVASATPIAAPRSEPSAASTPAEPFAASIAAPSGMRLDQMAATADRVLLRFAGPAGERILVVDPKSGQVTGTLSVIPSAP